MRLFPVVPLVSFVTALATQAPAQEQATATKATLSLSRHHTTNALDSPLALNDWYSLLRGSIEKALEHDMGSTRIAGEFELRHFDTYDFEDDASAALSVSTTIRASETLELRSTLSLGLVSEGDDLAIGDVVVGMRTRRATFAASLQAGLRLSPDTILVLESAASREKPGKTRFQADVLAPVNLESTRDRIRFAATLTRTHGSFSYGVFGAAGLLRTDPIGLLPQLRIADYGARLHGRIATETGAVLSGAIGIEALKLLDAPFSQTRLSYDLAAETPLPAGLSLRGSLKAGYDLASKDDPLAVWVRRYQAETGYRATAVLRFGAGIFIERRDNIGLETTERLRGIYGEAVWQAREQLAVTLRVDSTKRAFEGLDFERRAIEVQLGLSAKL